MKQCFVYEMFRQGAADPDILLGEANNAGADGVELWFREHVPFDELLVAAERHGLTVVSMVGHSGSMNDPAQRDQIVTQLRESIRVAADVGIANLIALSGERVGRSDEDGIAACAAVLADVAADAESAAVTINFEMLNSKRDHPDYQADSSHWGVTLASRVASPNVRLLYDCYHMQIMEGDLIDTIVQSWQWFGHVHTAGNPGRGPIDESQEIHYPAVMRALAATGYDRWVGHEFKPSADPMADLRTAIELCTI